MKVKNVRLHCVVYDEVHAVNVYDVYGNFVFGIHWGKLAKRTKPQAKAIANLLCDRFNAGQEGK